MIRRIGTRGFTLPELIVVIAILAILLLLLLPTFTNSTLDAKETVKKANTRTAHSAAKAALVQLQTRGWRTASGAPVAAADRERVLTEETLVLLGYQAPGTLTLQLTADGQDIDWVQWTPDGMQEESGTPTPRPTQPPSPTVTPDAGGDGGEDNKPASSATPPPRPTSKPTPTFNPAD